MQTLKNSSVSAVIPIGESAINREFILSHAKTKEIQPDGTIILSAKSESGCTVTNLSAKAIGRRLRAEYYLNV